MIACTGWYGTRPCGRPKGHSDDCGPMRMNYEPFKPVRSVREFRDVPGFEQGGTALTADAYAALATAKATGNPCEYVVMGRDVREDGVFFLRYGVTTDYIEATTDYRDDGTGLHYVCPDCGRKGGNHSRGCKAR